MAIHLSMQLHTIHQCMQNCSNAQAEGHLLSIVPLLPALCLRSLTASTWSLAILQGMYIMSLQFKFFEELILTDVA